MGAKFQVSLLIDYYYFSHQVNEMSRKVLQSIEAAIVAPKDNGNCLKHFLCQNNKMKTVSSNRIWLPVWG